MEQIKDISSLLHLRNFSCKTLTFLLYCEHVIGLMIFTLIMFALQLMCMVITVDAKFYNSISSLV